MLLDTQIELIKFFTLFIWVLNAVIAGLIFVCVGAVVWLCLAEIRENKVLNHQSARSPQRNRLNNSTTISKETVF